VLIALQYYATGTFQYVVGDATGTFQYVVGDPFLCKYHCDSKPLKFLVVLSKKKSFLHRVKTSFASAATPFEVAISKSCTLRM
jgi:hypothetical protein